MRVLLTTPDFPPQPGGIQLVMERLASNLPPGSARVVTLGSAGPGEDDVPRTFDLVRVRPSRLGHQFDVLRLNARTVRRAATWRPDVIVSGHVTTAPAATAAGAILRRPVVQYLHADEARTRPGLTRFAARRASRLIVVSRYAAELAAHCGAPTGRIRLVHPGVDVPDRATAARAERRTLVTVAAMLFAYKGHDVVLRALPSIARRVPDVEWVVIGDGPLRPGLEQDGRQLGIADRIRWLGAVSAEERDDWLDRAHVFVLPSRLPDEGTGGEGFGIAFLEAAAHGLPVVAGRIGGALDAVEDGRTGLLVDPRDPAAVADAVVELLLDPARAGQIGAAGARRASQFTWSRHIRRVQEVLAEAVAAR